MGEIGKIGKISSFRREYLEFFPKKGINLENICRYFTPESNLIMSELYYTPFHLSHRASQQADHFEPRACLRPQPPLHDGKTSYSSRRRQDRERETKNIQSYIL